MPETLVIRADASPLMGTGHVMRCLALAQVWQGVGRDAVFLSAGSTPALSTRLEAEGMQMVLLPDVAPGSVEDAEETAVLAHSYGADWVVIDGYHFGADYQKYLKDSGFRLLFWDDNGRAERYSADFILNQNLHARSELYECREPYTQLLLGTSYAVLRREYLPWQDWTRAIPETAQNILVTMGGSDPDNVTLKVIEALQQMGGNLQAIIVVGGSNPHYESLLAAVGSGSGSIQLRRDIKDMPPLLAWADMAISAAGSTCWELAYMGLPSIVLVLAENQEMIAYQLHRRNVALSQGKGTELDSLSIANAAISLASEGILRREMSSNGRKLVDGLGASRVIAAICSAEGL